MREAKEEIQNTDQLDAAGKSLSEALRISFVMLKIIMVVLVIVFLASGFRTVGADEQALVLRFGKIRGVGESRILGPGLHWIFPYPIDEIIKIPVAKKVNLLINSFWYFQTKEETLPEGPKRRDRVPEKLDPLKEGYCITRGKKQNPTAPDSAGSDYNIVHSKWQLTYKIDEPESFFKNIYVEDLKPGQIYFDVITKNLTPVLEDLVADAVVTALVNYTIDEVIFEQVGRVTEHVKRLLQEKLDKISSGIKVISVQLTDVTWPRQVNDAFWASIRASQGRQKIISEAKLYAEKTLNETVGSLTIADQLLTALNDANATEQQKELLWSQLSGRAQEKIAQARAYRTEVVESAKANAEYLKKILPEYRKRPELVIQKIYLDAIEYVLNSADEKIIIQPAEGTRGKEIRVLLNRDPAIKSKSEQVSR